MTLLPTVRGKRKEGRVKPIEIEEKQFKFFSVLFVGKKRKTRKCYENRENTKTMSFF
jgi:hypothetical protein